MWTCRATSPQHHLAQSVAHRHSPSQRGSRSPYAFVDIQPTFQRELTSHSTASDLPFVLRMVVQSLLPGSPPDLSIEGQSLSFMVQAIAPTEPESALASNDLSEYCPACRVEVPLQDITTAVCSNGHTWGECRLLTDRVAPCSFRAARCSITTFILSTPLVRTCVGCSRKAFLPLSSRDLTSTPNWLPPAARGWVVEELLEAVHRCLFCNNSFVSVL